MDTWWICILISSVVKTSVFETCRPLAITRNRRRTTFAWVLQRMLGTHWLMTTAVVLLPASPVALQWLTKKHKNNMSSTFFLLWISFIWNRQSCTWWHGRIKELCQCKTQDNPVLQHPLLQLTKETIGAFWVGDISYHGCRTHFSPWLFCFSGAPFICRPGRPRSRQRQHISGQIEGFAGARGLERPPAIQVCLSLRTQGDSSAA